MTNQPLHPGDELVELALGDVGEPQRSNLIRHLAACAPCRAAYDDIVVAVDATLPAAPHIAPPVGFEQRVLTGIDAQNGAPVPARPSGRPARARLMLAAAAVVIAALLGGVVAVSVWGGDEATAPPLAADTGWLRTSDGEVVGTAAATYFDGESVVVVSISRPAVGIPYHCRIVYADGHRVDAGRWTVDDPGGSTWVTRAPPGHVVGMDLVTDDGRVWVSTRLS